MPHTEKTPIIQFGTSRFLQAHADLFLCEGTPARAITVVQSSGDPGRAARLSALADPAGFPVRIRGIENGRVIDEEHRVHSVRRTLSTATDWPELENLVIDEAEIILSNTGDNGFDPCPSDTSAKFDQAMSYPAKLYHLLSGRFLAAGTPLTIFPMELIPENGRVLRERVLEIARQQGAAPAHIDWLNACLWANSLVDRIVSEPIDPVGAVAEPYALWAIENQPGLTAPTVHSAIQMVDALEAVERLKLHILNLGHTVLASFWKDGVGNPDALVRELLREPDGRRMRRVIEDEVLPGFAAHQMGEEAEEYLATTLERFSNPFLDHRIADIAQNHPQKVARRITAFLAWARTADPGYCAPTLEKIAAEGAPS
ncbi:mannitol dehydrogenase family protein [Qingshengfaniella alkalisoli]|uniref:Mannitol dehydrogenase family protein n=1 Tax=Qingshengfaniella alkalisoli TaxID=2599296 RepID=A0A5B8J1W9_9RHOB|nr:mannitol dehydrogenase family protein [Qingshengfaniella alkalisoli]QDY68220.1 mannitol dehydrogenase family protein [Qingshengfaniella alkalisoli]